MRILLITGYFPPERAAGPNLNYELARELVQLGHRVTVATGFPRYNLREVPAEYRKKLYMRECMEGVVVIRMWYPAMPRNNRIARGLDMLLMAAALMLSAVRAGQQDVATVFSPPITVGLTGIVASWLFGYRFVYNAHDLFPQNAVDLGLLRNRALIRTFTAMARVVYQRAAFVTVISASNKDRFVAAGARPDRTIVLPDWVDTELVAPVDRQTRFSAENGLNDKFVVSFSGVMGYSQDLDTVLAAARLLAHKPAIHFLLAGDGVERPRLEAEVARLRLTNMTFLGMIPHREVAAVFQSSDVCLATLRASVKTSPVPSKIVWAMATARPVITCLDLEGDAPKLVREADCGISLPPNDPHALAEAILRLAAQPAECRRMGENGRAFVLSHLSVKAAAAKLCVLFEEVIGQRPDRNVVRERSG
jgi:glycosyltransferase involved in cell wall biosynthesis